MGFGGLLFPSHPVRCSPLAGALCAPPSPSSLPARPTAPAPNPETSLVSLSPGAVNGHLRPPSRVFSMEACGNPRGRKAGIISRIRLENFMCHSSLQIEFGDWVNFITGQNGSGKSAILTALCVAFGCRARDTQRASHLKDFIKIGCSYATVLVEMKNQGEDAFKPEIYGDLIMVERRITESTSSTFLKDSLGKRITRRKNELHELVEHFNIDVENPCVIMSQDKSREFLHSGNDKEKFKFFFKATLLQQVSELLQNIRSQLDAANAMVDELESSIKPIQKELNGLQEKIRIWSILRK